MKFLLFAISLLLITPAFVTGQRQPEITLRGQIVCSVCWFEAADRKVNKYGTAEDISCALDCSEQGIPQALAVGDEKGFTLYTLEPGAYKPSGKDFLDLVPKFAEITGTLRTSGDKRFLKVDELRVLPDPIRKPAPVSDAPELALNDITGSRQSLSSLKGRVVVLNFWATWCVPCQKEMPDLAAIQNDYAALGVQVIGAAGDEAADGAKVLKFVRDYKVNFPVWVGATTDDMQRFGVGTVLPATVIIDRDGKIVWREIGIIDPTELRKKLDGLLLPKVEQAAAIAKAETKPKASLVPA